MTAQAIMCAMPLQHCPGMVVSADDIDESHLNGKVGLPPLLNLPFDLRNAEVMAAWPGGVSGAGVDSAVQG